MKIGIWLVLCAVGSLCGPALSQDRSNSSHKPPAAAGLTPSEHRPGPHGLEGWTLDGPIPDDAEDKYAFVLVIAREGKEVRRIDGDPFVWKWMFAEDGKRVAYESGPLHFSMSCVLLDIATGRKLETYDCYQELPANAPQWVEALEALR